MALSEFLMAVKSIVRVACDNSLTETGFVPDPPTDGKLHFATCISYNQFYDFLLYMYYSI